MNTEPVNPLQGSGNSCEGEGTFSITETGTSVLGCGGASLDATNKILEKIKRLKDQTCGKNCDAKINIEKTTVVKDCWKSGFLGTSSNIKLKAEGKIECSGKPKDNKYKVTIIGNACRNCAKVKSDGNVQN